MTWSVPVMVFFTSIIGWQYFVGHRSVPAGKCYVQYMDDALFNCVLQVGYFWITLTAMILLYTGIYQVALQLHRRYEALVCGVDMEMVRAHSAPGHASDEGLVMDQRCGLETLGLDLETPRGQKSWSWSWS